MGYTFAATELVQTQGSAMMSAIWRVKSLVGFVASTPRAAEANAVLGHMIASFALDPGWMARQQQMDAQTNLIVQRSNQAVSNAIAQNGRTLAASSDMAFKAGQASAQRTFNANERFDEDVVKQTGSYTVPGSGYQSTLNNTYAHQYMLPNGETLGTNSETPPQGATEMQRVPPGQ